MPNNRRIPSRLSSCRSPLQHSPTLGLMGPIIWPSKAHRGATRPANRAKARRRQPRSFSLLDGGSACPVRREGRHSTSSLPLSSVQSVESDRRESRGYFLRNNIDPPVVFPDEAT